MAFKKGQSGNPSGRKRSNWREHFDAAIAADTKKHKQSIFEHAIEQARKDNTLLAAILRKCLPDLKTLDAQVNTESPFQFIIERSSGEKVELPKPETKQISSKVVANPIEPAVAKQKSKVAKPKRSKARDK